MIAVSFAPSNRSSRVVALPLPLLFLLLLLQLPDSVTPLPRVASSPPRAEVISRPGNGTAPASQQKNASSGGQNGGGGGGGPIGAFKVLN